MKYVKRNNSTITLDYQYYLGQENIFTVLFGHKPKGYKKANYIWKSLLNQYRDN